MRQGHQISYLPCASGSPPPIQVDVEPPTVCLPLLQVERVRDESVGLRALQTALTLMQNPLFADDEVTGGRLN